jgi:hypothetical protein
MDPKILKIVITVVILLIAVPVLLPIIQGFLPEPITFERAVAGFQQAGLPVTDHTEVATPQLEAIAQLSMRIGNAQVDIYHYDNEGKIVKQLEYQKKDAGTAMVETWNLAQSLGAAPSRNRPSVAARKGMFMIVATGDDKALLNRIVNTFRSL